jgi:hypothetical protein
MKDLAWAVSSNPIQRTANTRRKCPGEEQHVPPNGTQSAHGKVRARCDLARRFSVGTAVTKKLPISARRTDIGRPSPFVFAVVPFQQKMIDFGHLAKPASSQVERARCNGLTNTLSEGQSFETLAETESVAFAALRQRQIRQARMLAGETPRCLAMPG